MKEKQDVGNLIKNDLDTQSVSAPESGWDRIEKSLDAKRKKRRGFLFLIFSGVAIISLLFILNIIPQDESKKTTIEELQSDEEIELTEVIASEKTKTDSIVNTETQLMSDEEIELKTGSQNITETKQNKKAGLDSFTESKTTYFYFRSIDNKNVVSEDRQVIDSLMREENNTIIQSDSLQ